ncbi:CBS domain-containing protein [Candidatus Pacearchaeota archaeon]|nr:CBS domain-containing protein [Candidatus Pacearchaeota archaeon]
MDVRDIMKEPFVIEDDMSLADAAELMSEKNIGCLLFLSNASIKGIITERDLLKNFRKNKKVSQVMNKKVVTIGSEKELSEAYELMKQSNIKRLPVIENEKLVGIITATDLLASADELDEYFFF